MRPVTDQPLALRGYGECCLTSQIRSRFLVGWPNQTALAFDDHGPMVLVAENDGVVFLGGKTGIDADAYQNNFRTRAIVSRSRQSSAVTSARHPYCAAGLPRGWCGCGSLDCVLSTAASRG
jgi:hypothetical protein